MKKNEKEKQMLPMVPMLLAVSVKAMLLALTIVADENST